MSEWWAFVIEDGGSIDTLHYKQDVSDLIKPQACEDIHPNPVTSEASGGHILNTDQLLNTNQPQTSTSSFENAKSWLKIWLTSDVYAAQF